LNATASRFEAEIGDEVKRAEAGRYNINLANRKLQELGQAAPGLDADVLRKEFLNITRAIDPKELSGNLREAMSVALREEAQHERQLEAEAREFRKQLVSPSGILSEIKKSLDNLKPTAGVPGVAAVSPVAAGDDAGDVVRVNARAYPSKEAYEPLCVRQTKREEGLKGETRANTRRVTRHLLIVTFCGAQTPTRRRKTDFHASSRSPRFFPTRIFTATCAASSPSGKPTLK
jgi:hypothetical protein